jgi:hypothetical protein
MKLGFFILILTLASCTNEIAPSPDSIIIDGADLKLLPDYVKKKELPQFESETTKDDLYGGVKKSVWDDLARF